ncbi:MAG: Fe-S-containing hydro-lyase [Loktanella sp.]|nr:Fe-S-containing hydro-lyase [Loktanella sp.]
MIRLQLPLRREDIASLRAGDEVLLSGTVYTGRDAAHKRLYEAMQRGEELPVDLTGQLIYYVGPAPAKPGQPIGPAGPTTSYRMDPYTPALLDAGMAGMIGKGQRTEPVRQAIIRNGAVYFITIGGAAALIADSIRSKETVCYEDLGTESVCRLEVEDFYAIVGIDAQGNSIL